MIRVYSANFSADDYLMIAACFRHGLRYMQEIGADIVHPEVEKAIFKAAEYCQLKAATLNYEKLADSVWGNDKG